MKNQFLYFKYIVIAISLSACGGGDGLTSIQGNNLTGIQQFKDCNEMQSFLDQQTKTAVEAAQQAAKDPDASPGSGVSTQADLTGEREIQGLEEADTSKVNDQYLVSLTNEGEWLEVVDVSDPGRLQPVADLNLRSRMLAPIEMLLQKDRIILISRKIEDEEPHPDPELSLSYFPIDYSTTTVVSILRVASGQIQTENQYEIEGTYVAARVSSDSGRALIITNRTNALYNTEYKDGAIEVKEAGLDSLEARGRKKENESNLEPACECKDVNYVGGFNGMPSNILQTTNIHSVQLKTVSNELKHEMSLMGQSALVRATAEAIVFSMAPLRYYPFSSSTIGRLNDSPGQTMIALAAEKNGKLQFIAEGKVEGSVDDQHQIKPGTEVVQVFSHQHSPQMSMLQTLVRRGNKLVQSSSIDGIGENEYLNSTLFTNNWAFAVTFKKTDPFYLFDMRNAKQPRLTGELKIPGFSEQLRLTKEGHILGIGRDASDEGSFALFQAVQISLFEINDLGQPSQITKEFYGDRDTYSPAAGAGTNAFADGYKQYLFDRDQGLLVLPATQNPVGTSGWSLNPQGQPSILVIRIQNGSIELIAQDEDFNAHVDRVLSTDSHYFAVSRDEVVSYRLDQPTTPLGRLDF